MPLTNPHESTYPTAPSIGQVWTQSIQLTRGQAARWLTVLQRSLSRVSQQPTLLEQLQDQLKEACWLARWKREYVVLELCPTSLTSLVDQIRELRKAAPPGSCNEFGEQNVAPLSELGSEQPSSKNSAGSPSHGCCNEFGEHVDDFEVLEEMSVILSANDRP